MKLIRKKQFTFFSWNILYFCITMFYTVNIEILVFGKLWWWQVQMYLFAYISLYFYRRLQEDIYSHKIHLKLIYIGFMNMFNLTSPSLHWFCFSSGQIINWNICFWNSRAFGALWILCAKERFSLDFVTWCLIGL